MHHGLRLSTDVSQFSACIVARDFSSELNVRILANRNADCYVNRRHFLCSAAHVFSPSAQAYQISKERLIEVHEFMRDELQILANEAGSCAKVDTKVLTLAAQAYVGAKVQKKFGLTGEDIEGAVLLNHKELATNATFTLVNMAIQKIMNDLIDAEA